MSAKRWIRPCLVLGALGGAALAVAAPAAPDQVVEAVDCLCAGGEFHPLPPYRAFDSRPASAINDPSPGRKAIDPSREFSIRLADVGALPAASEILAVVASVTVVEPNAPGWLAVRPGGTTVDPTKQTSLVNFLPGRNVPNLAIVGLGPNGSITVTMGPSKGGTAHVLVDVVGYLSKSSSTGERGARLIPIGPGRLTDSRTAGGPYGAGEVRAVPIRGAVFLPDKPPIPNDPSVTAALVNIAAVNNRPGSKATFLTAAPAPPSRPVATSNVNVVAGQIKTSLAVVPVVDGKIYIYNHAGSTDVIVDVFGYFKQSADGDESTKGRIVPLDTPFRAFDTRDAAKFGNVPLGTFTVEDWSFEAFAGSVTLANSSLDLSQQSALLGNLTGADLRRLYPTVPVSTYLTAYPGGQPRPLAANLNVAEREVVPNMSLIRYSLSGDPYVVKVYNHMGSIHYLLDVYAIVLK